MAPVAASRKRFRPGDAAVIGSNGAAAASKKAKDMESYQSVTGSKSKPCTKFFSTVGCPFGENCHFLHYVPGGISAAAKMINLSAPPLPTAKSTAHSAQHDVPTPPAVKTRICNKFNTAEGCKFGDKCHFAHGERELGKPIVSVHDHQMVGSMAGRLGGRVDPPPPAAGLGAAAAAASFGASATAKISVDASLAGAIIGKAGVNSKQICRITGARLSIKEHESDPNLRNIELEGSFDQIKQASAMVRELIVNVSATNPPVPAKNVTAAATGPNNNFKTKLCENFPKGSCTFGDRCHFAHGPGELRKPGV